LHMLIEFLLVLYHFSLISIAAFCWRDSPLSMYAAEGILAHVSAFVGIEFFGNQLIHWSHEAQHAGGFTVVLLVYIIGPPIGYLFFSLLRMVSKPLRATLHKRMVEAHGHVDAGSDHHGSGEHAHGHTDGHEQGHQRGQALSHEHCFGEHIDAWLHESDEAEEEARAIFVGFLLSRLCVALVIRRMPKKFMLCDDAEDSCMHTNAEIGFFFAIILLQLLCLPGASKIKEQLGGAQVPVFVERILNAEMIISYSIGWGLCSLTRWVVTSWLRNSITGGRAGAELLGAFVISPLFSVVIITTDVLADRRFIGNHFAHVIMNSAGLLIGIKWEKAFGSSIEYSVHYSTSGQLHPVLFNCILGTIIVSILLPAWRWWIVPVAIKPVPDRKSARIREIGEQTALPPTLTLEPHPPAQAAWDASEAAQAEMPPAAEWVSAVPGALR